MDNRDVVGEFRAIGWWCVVIYVSLVIFYAVASQSRIDMRNRLERIEKRWDAQQEVK